MEMRIVGHPRERSRRQLLGPRGTGLTKVKRLGCRRVAELAMPVCWKNLCLPGKRCQQTPACLQQRTPGYSAGRAKGICSMSVLPEAAPPLGRGKCVRASKSLLGAASGISGLNPAPLGLLTSV